MTTAGHSIPDASATSRPFPLRRLFQYRLRTLLIVTTIISIWLGWWSYKARQQREEVAQLRKTFAVIRYDFEEGNLKRPPHWPARLVDSMGVDYFANVTQVVFFADTTGREITDSDFTVLRDFGSLESLDLLNTEVTDAGLKHLKYLKYLKHLTVNHNITDAGVEQLQGLSALQTLDLDYTQVTDIGVEHLKGLAALEELHLRNTQVTDAGLEHLKGLAALQVLVLYNTKVTDKGVARLKHSLPNCSIHHRPR